MNKAHQLVAVYIELDIENIICIFNTHICGRKLCEHDRENTFEIHREKR